MLSSYISFAGVKLAPLPKGLEKGIVFHGHICNGFAKGYIAVKAAEKKLQGKGFEGTPILPIAENNQCGLDAIQITLKENSAFGNTTGNRARGLIVEDVGKDAFKFIRLVDMKGIRVVIKPGVVEKIFHNEEWEYNVMKRKYFLGIAHPKDKKKLMDIEKKNLQHLLALPLEDVCYIRELTHNEISDIEYKYLSKLGPPDNEKLVCPICGETFLASRAKKADGKMLCIPCAKKTQNGKQSIPSDTGQ